LLETGRAQTAKLVDRFDRYIADSEFNADELRAMGAADVRAVPVIIDYSRFDISPDRNVLAQRSRTANVLFVGRVSPSKGILALIDVFEAYLCFDPGAHLTIVGRYDTRDAYYQAVVDAIRDRRLRRVVTLAGVVDEAALLAYYQTADIYLSLSEHEGFCVPVVEAMFFDVPVVALGTTAVPETVGAGGLLIEPGMDRFEIAGLMHAVADDRALRATILAAARERRQYYLPQAAQQRLDGLVDTLLPA
jgi:glycosyltransferase involved in cell wall biosynthesis